MPGLNDVLVLQQRRFVATINFALEGQGDALVRTGVLAENGFLDTEQQRSLILPNTTGPAGLASTVADLMTRAGLDPATATVRQVVRALVNEAMNPPV